MQHIETVTLNALGTSTIQFLSIPQDFTDLLIKVSARSNVSGTRTNLLVRPNGSSANASDRRLLGYDSSQVQSSTASNITLSVVGNTSTADTFSNNDIYIPNYTSSSAKSVSGESAVENNSTSSYLVMLTAGLWNDTTPITSLDLVLSSGSFMQYSSISLFGITAGSDGIVAVS